MCVVLDMARSMVCGVLRGVGTKFRPLHRISSWVLGMVVRLKLVIYLFWNFSRSIVTQVTVNRFQARGRICLTRLGKSALYPGRR